MQIKLVSLGHIVGNSTCTLKSSAQELWEVVYPLKPPNIFFSCSKEANHIEELWAKGVVHFVFLERRANFIERA